MSKKAQELNQINRRRSKRYEVVEEIFITFKPGFKFVGKLMDISTGGLAFEYIIFGDCDVPKIAHAYIFSQQHFDLTRINCKIIYDDRIDCERPPNVHQIRRCGVAFSSLCGQELNQFLPLFRFACKESFS